MAFVVLRAGKSAVSRNLTSYLRPASFETARRCLSTSKKNGETATVSEKLPSHSPAGHNSQVDLDAAVAKAAKRNWLSLGFSKQSQEDDAAYAHLLFFTFFSVCLVGSMMVYTYSPDRKMRDWAHREAYLLIREREALGLPHVDPNMVDPSKIVLPSEEELGDFEIVI